MEQRPQPQQAYGRPANTPKTVNKPDDERDKPRVMTCHWCPIQIQYDGSHWQHVDGGSCQSHRYNSNTMIKNAQLVSKLAGDPSS